MRAALTGATGFLGIHLLPALLEAGFEVRILARREPAHPAWRGLSFETVRGDLADAAALRELAAGADMVVHAAGLIKALSRREFLAVNLDGTAAMAAAARAAGAKFLLVSSLAARAPELSDYAFSKRQAELSAEAVIRPPAIYGPWDRETLALFKTVSGGFAPLTGRGRIAFIHARDAAGAIAAYARNWRPGVFEIADTRPEGYSMRELLLTAAQACGGAPWLVPVPKPVLLGAGYGAAAWAKLTGKPRIFGPGKAREMLHPDWAVRPAASLPGEIYAPRIGLAEGFAETVAWYRQAGWLGGV